MVSIPTQLVIAAVFLSFLGGLVSALLPMIKPSLTQAEKDWYLGLSVNAGIVLFLGLLSNFSVRANVIHNAMGAVLVLGSFALYFGEYMDTDHTVDPLAWGVVKIVSLGILFYVYSALNGFPNPLKPWKSEGTSLTRSLTPFASNRDSLFNTASEPSAHAFDGFDLEELGDGHNAGHLE